MPTKTPAKVATTPRKTRKKVTSTTTKYQQPVAIKKVEKPEVTLISRQDYIQDVKNRWQIHQFETQELWKDLVKGYNFVVPYVQKSVTYVKQSYDRAFNETT